MSEHVDNKVKISDQSRMYEPHIAREKPAPERQPSSSALPEPLLTVQLIGLPPTHKSKCTTGLVKAFAANSHTGPYRSYNEDRMTIITNVKKPIELECDEWPQV